MTKSLRQQLEDKNRIIEELRDYIELLTAEFNKVARRLYQAQSRNGKSAQRIPVAPILRPTPPPSARRPAPEKWVVPTIELRALLEPLIELNSVNWLAVKVGTNTVNLESVLYGQKFADFKIVDRWITKLGIPQAFHDGTLSVVILERSDPLCGE